MAKTNKTIQQFIEGDKKAFEKLYDRYSSRVFSIAVRYTRCHDDARDVFQETFISVYEKRETYNTMYPIWAWMKKITINTSLHYIRKNYKLILTDNDKKLDSTIDEAEEIKQENIEEFKQKLYAILNQLPDGYRTIFNLYAIDGLTHKEIAQYLGITEGNSRTQFHKAKRMIRRLLDKDTNYETVA